MLVLNIFAYSGFKVQGCRPLWFSVW